MTLRDRLLVIADLAYRLRQTDGSGPVYDSNSSSIGLALDVELELLHKKLGKPYSKRPLQKRRRGRVVERFRLQPTTSFPEGAPQRESYNTDEDLFKAEKEYAVEWRKEFKCPGCEDMACPQCGKDSR